MHIYDCLLEGDQHSSFFEIILQIRCNYIGFGKSNGKVNCVYGEKLYALCHYQPKWNCGRLKFLRNANEYRPSVLPSSTCETCWIENTQLPKEMYFLGWVYKYGQCELDLILWADNLYIRIHSNEKS